MIKTPLFYPEQISQWNNLSNESINQILNRIPYKNSIDVKLLCAPTYTLMGGDTYACIYDTVDGSRDIKFFIWDDDEGAFWDGESWISKDCVIDEDNPENWLEDQWLEVGLEGQIIGESDEDFSL